MINNNSELKIGNKIFSSSYFWIDKKLRVTISGYEIIKINNISYGCKRILVYGYGNKIGEKVKIKKEKIENYFLTFDDAFNVSCMVFKRRIKTCEKELDEIPKELKILDKSLIDLINKRKEIRSQLK